LFLFCCRCLLCYNKTKIEGDVAIAFCAAIRKKKATTSLLPSVSLVHCNKKKKVITTLLSLPSLLHQNEIEGDDNVAFYATKKAKGDGKNVAVTFFTSTKQKEEGNDNILAIAFFAML
jgi:hypothetical protein